MKIGRVNFGPPETPEQMQERTLKALAAMDRVAVASFKPPRAAVVEYVTEEVARQGHDLTTRDGIERVGWMLNAWTHALKIHDMHKPLLGEAVHLGTLVEPDKNYHGLRTCGVRVGLRVCPPPDRVEPMLLVLFEQIDKFTPIEFYKHFEEIHPFVDGNGRTGKILLNWLNGTLLNPIFPPSDLWGHPIRNP